MRTSLLGGMAVAVLLLSLAACGGGGKTTTTAGGMSAEQWANGLCSSFTTWKKSLESIKTEVVSQPSESQLRKAERQIEDSTETLVRSLKDLGAPNTAQGEAAQQNLEKLVTSLENGFDKIKEASSSDSSTLSQIATISTTLASMANDLELAGSNLKNLAPSGELQQAFHQASACQAYVH